MSEHTDYLGMVLRALGILFLSPAMLFAHVCDKLTHEHTFDFSWERIKRVIRHGA